MRIKFIPQVHGVNEDVANTGRTQGGRDFVIFVISIEGKKEEEISWVFGIFDLII